MSRIVLTYGIISALLVASGMLIPIGLGTHSLVIGYLTMLVALSMVFVGVKRYRDVHLGGAIGFWRAFGVGLAIAGIAMIGYVIAWEIYLAATDHAFMREYAEGAIAARKAEGASAAELARMRAEFDGFAEQYRKPVFRLAVTASEIAPVGLLVSLVTAALVRRPGFMPARSGAFDKGDV